MNNIQKIFVLVGVGGLFVFIVTITLLNWSITEPIVIPPTYSSIKRINWYGVVSLFNILISVVGFFLFKDK